MYIFFVQQNEGVFSITHIINSVKSRLAFIVSCFASISARADKLEPECEY